MAKQQGYIFNKKGAGRIVKAVRKSEGMRDDVGGVDSLPRFPTQWFIGIIVENSFTDCRYTVGRARVTNDDSDDKDAKIEVTEFDESHPLHFRCTANNLAEFTSNTHNLTVGTPVWVQYDYDYGHKPRYRFVAGGAGGSESVGEFTGQIHTSLDNVGDWLLDVYVPDLP